ncbi:efflux RND transporter permease subunit [Thiococcus pfennigii]|jgi:multidrug efflux pump subunit AcrB|uniref:efflux RND transporter permease subunit n=1 Tax=Thiococcus pfennigii TaxID=1057 RepID=UPI001903B264|nr:efflux RND transporter permease subunit [Thiococcus pfennigii]MBK1699532.1 acriflavine resistance protein B [Thiococcus pfennigii]MBK1730688.1 acriflavine resistance protein B [Thiococcus pfennigii]
MTERGGIIGWFAANPVAANLLMVLIIALGVLQVDHLRKEAFPSLEPDSITVSVTYDSGSAKQSEEGIAIKIEDQLEGLTGIKTVTSTSTGRGATVTIEKQSDYDLDALLRDVKAKVDAITNFPADADKPVIEKAEREEHAIWLQLYGDVDRHTLQRLADDLKSDLLADPEVNRVTFSGWLDPMMVVEIDEGRLQAYGLSLADVEDAINAGSSDTLTAVMRNADLYLQLQASQQAYRKQEFAAIPLIDAADGSQILLGDVTEIRDTYDDTSSSLSRFQGRNSIGVQVITTGLDDIGDTVAGAHRVVDAWRAGGKLPQGVALETWYDRSTNIEERLQLLVKNALTGIVMVFLLLALFLNLTVAFWVAAGLPFIFFGALFFMGDQFLGLSLNLFTTFGFIMALGIVVDDAVVVGESVYTVRSMKGDTLANTVAGTLKVAVPTLFGVFTTVAAFYALSQVSGRLGQVYAQFAAVVTLCLILSVIESKLILPAHLAHLHTRRRASRNRLLRLWQGAQRGADAGLAWFSERLYQPLIEQALIHRYAVVLAFIALFVLVISMPFTGAIRMSFFPDILGDTVRAQLTMRNDASFGQTHAALELLEAKAYETDRALRATAGDETDGDEDGASAIAHLQVLSSGDQSGRVTVELRQGAPYDIKEFTNHWRRLAGLPEGARTLMVQHSPRMVAALRVELRANDDEVLTLAGEALKAALEEIPGVSGIEDNLEPAQPQLRLELTQQGRALGMTTAMLARQLLQSFSGQVVQRYQRDSDEIEVRVRYPEAARQNAADVLNARVRTPDGTVVPLASVATATYGYTRDTITRIDNKRAVYVSSDVNKDLISATELVAQLQRDVAPLLEAKYPGLDLHFAGEAEQQAETQSSMLQMFLLALLGIYLLLAVPLKSYWQPIVIMMAIPFGIVGALLGHWVNGLSLGILSLNGIIALSGVVVNDSLLLVARFNDLKPDAAHLHEAVGRACRERLRAVLLTSLTTFAGLAPLLYETSIQAQFLIPAAVSLGYGILFATVITLILIPTLLVIQHDVADLPGRLRRRLAPKKGL